MISTARLLVLVSVSWFGAEGVAMACDALTTVPTGGRTWLYVRLVDAKTNAVIDIQAGQIVTRNTPSEPPSPVSRNGQCFVPAVPDNAQSVDLEANANGYIGRHCRPEVWRSYIKPDSPYDCRLIPRPGSMADAGVTRVADLKLETARKDAIADAVDFALRFDPSESVGVLEHLSERLDVRQGLLAQELLTRQGLTNCTGSECINKLPDGSVRSYLAANSAPIDSELLRVKQEPVIRKDVTDLKLKEPLIKLMQDPSRDATFTVDSANAPLKNYIRTRFPDKAEKLKVFVDANFDPAIASQNLKQQRKSQ